ncbi:MAG: GNAT family N-acetyltransferase [Phycisphaerales bacterium]|nr:GNAT family N-acetyltransferase [Phycisphaerales bacterium]
MPAEVRIVPVDASNAGLWCAMRREMGPAWLTDDFETLAAEYLAKGRIQRLPHLVVLAVGEAGGALGFAEVSLRDYAEGCLSSPVGYLEGWFVAPEARGRGVGRLLVRACERWAAERGCTEFASDAEIDNGVSLRAHAALGFEPVADVRLFRKPIG